MIRLLFAVIVASCATLAAAALPWEWGAFLCGPAIIIAGLFTWGASENVFRLALFGLTFIQWVVVSYLLSLLFKRGQDTAGWLMRVYMQALRKTFDFHGRAPLEEFWVLVLGSNLIVMPLAFYFYIGLPWANPLGIAGAFLLMLVPYTAAAVRRLHDSGFSAWWLLIVFVPVVGGLALLILLLLPGELKTNRFGTGQAILEWEEEHGSLVEERTRSIEARRISDDARLFKGRSESDVEQHIERVCALFPNDAERWWVRHPESQLYVRFENAAARYAADLRATITALNDPPKGIS